MPMQDLGGGGGQENKRAENGGKRGALSTETHQHFPGGRLSSGTINQACSCSTVNTSSLQCYRLEQMGRGAGQWAERWGEGGWRGRHYIYYYSVTIIVQAILHQDEQRCEHFCIFIHSLIHGRGEDGEAGRGAKSEDSAHKPQISKSGTWRKVDSSLHPSAYQPSMHTPPLGRAHALSRGVILHDLPFERGGTNRISAGCRLCCLYPHCHAHCHHRHTDTT